MRISNKSLAVGFSGNFDPTLNREEQSKDVADAVHDFFIDAESNCRRIGGCAMGISTSVPGNDSFKVELLCNSSDLGQNMDGCGLAESSMHDIAVELEVAFENIPRAATSD